MDIKKEWLEFFDELELTNKINDLLNIAYQDEFVLPPRSEALNLFQQIAPSNVRVVIIGQDPYHTPGVANGIAFSSKQPKTPPSLRNIFKELKSDLGIERLDNDLTDWVNQGILLINPIWTVQKGKPNSHEKLGWQQITEAILRELYQRNEKLIFCLWGNGAKCLYNNLQVVAKNVIVSAHPSPFSYYRGFEHSKPFSKINEIINEQNLGEKIKW